MKGSFCALSPSKYHSSVHCCTLTEFLVHSNTALFFPKYLASWEETEHTTFAFGSDSKKQIRSKFFCPMFSYQIRRTLNKCVQYYVTLKLLQSLEFVFLHRITFLALWLVLWKTDVNQIWNNYTIHRLVTLLTIVFLRLADK